MDTDQHSGAARADRQAPPPTVRTSGYVIVPGWVLDADLTPAQRHVYVTLRRFCDNTTNQAWPSRRTIADRAGCSVDAVDRAVKRLVEVGAVYVTKRVGTDGGPASNLYVLPLDEPVPGVAAPVQPGGRAGAARGSRASAALTRPSSRTRPPQPPEGGREREPDGFAEWYARYPRHVGRRAAARAYRAALRRGATVDRLAEVLTAWLPELRQREARFVPHPATFLNSGDAETPPPSGDGVDVHAEHVVVGRRYVTAERADPTLTALWHRIESLRARSSDPAVAAERADAESTYAERAAAALGVQVVVVP